MTESRSIQLGGRTFAVPMLPLRHNRVIYPICRDLCPSDDDGQNETSFAARIRATGGQPECVHDAEWDKLVDVAFRGAQAADPTLTRDQFEDLPISPNQLIEAFFAIRLQTGVWVAAPQPIEGDQKTGEAEGAAEPQ